MNGPIDVVIPWVDGNDPNWINCMNKYKNEKQYPNVSTANYRFRSWDNLQYIFRGIEKFMPWVNRVFLITSGHLPPFIDSSCQKLICVKHEDYIPQKYLPTFNTNTIEMNLHRIEELSENFILFNDDLFPIQSVLEEYYFVDDKVCDQAVQTIVVPSPASVSIYQCQYLNNIRLINKHFNKRDVINNNREKWFSSNYSEEDLAHNTNLEYWNMFTGFRTHHMAQSYKKSILKEIWDCEEDLLDFASQNRFRNYSDITDYVIRYWQLCKGDFFPRKALGRTFEIYKMGVEPICDFIRNQEDIMVSIEDVYLDDKTFNIARELINKEFERLLPEKSVFEK